ncbi:MAG: AMIN domain-containing protein, partial [Alphaproteobacteria bacterium]|nr:AMIN domain-containing protein [Alphaproteobacteria bacterium]
MKKTCAFVWLILCCFLWTTPVFAAQIKNIRLAKYQPNVVRLVVETDEKPNTKIFTLTNPDRIVVDFKNAYFSKSAPSKVPAVDFIKSLRRGVPDKQTARLVVEIPDKTVSENHFNLKPSGKTGWRFVMDIKKNGAKETNASSDTLTKKETTPATKKTIASVPIKKPAVVSKGTPLVSSVKTSQKSMPQPVVNLKKKAKKIVVLDPGHG